MYGSHMLKFKVLSMARSHIHEVTYSMLIDITDGNMTIVSHNLEAAYKSHD